MVAARRRIAAGAAAFPLRPALHQPRGPEVRRTMAAGAHSFRACQQRSCGGNRSAQTELECLRVRLGEAERGLSERRLEADEVRTRHHIPHTVANCVNAHPMFPRQLTESCP